MELRMKNVQNNLSAVPSSYAKNNYGMVFMLTVLAWRPHNCVELGSLHGYSTLHIAAGLRIVHGMFQHQGHLFVHDLWEDYPFNHGSMEDVQKRLNDAYLEEYVTLNKSEAFEVHKQWGHRSVHLLHVDLSNNGGTVRHVMDNWHMLLDMHGVIMFEGGSLERDEVEWMKKFDKKPMHPEIINNKTLNDNYIYGTYEPFPSMTVCIKKDEK